MKVATKAGRTAALKVILSEAVDMEMVRSKACGDIFFVKRDYIYFEFICNSFSKLVLIFTVCILKKTKIARKRERFILGRDTRKMVSYVKRVGRKGKKNIIIN